MNSNYVNLDPPISTGFFTDRNEKNQLVVEQDSDKKMPCKKEIAVNHKIIFIKNMDSTSNKSGKMDKIYQIGMNILSNAGSSLCEIGTFLLKNLKGFKLKALNFSLTINFVYKQVSKESKEEYTNKNQKQFIYQNCGKCERDILSRKRSNSLPTTNNTNPIPC